MKPRSERFKLQVQVGILSEDGQTATIGDSPIRSGDQIFIPERSWLRRNSGAAGAMIAGVISLTIALFVR